MRPGWPNAFSSHSFSSFFPNDAGTHHGRTDRALVDTSFLGRPRLGMGPVAWKQREFLLNVGLLPVAGHMGWPSKCRDTVK
jgi:hypothetical protein